MLNLSVDNWQYLHGAPLMSATIKQQLSDFKVTETLSFSPSGEGEHRFIYIEKTGLNTAFVAEELAKFAKLPLRAVSYAGRKDKYATTRQWFGVYFGGKQQQSRKSVPVKPADINWQAFDLAGVKVLEVTQNDRKLRVGSIKVNEFDILLRHINPLNADLLTQRLSDISQRGVPNYYGNQRFGELIKTDGSVQLGGNLALAEKLVNGEDIRNRNKKSMAISALRSWLFNHCVSQRLANTKYLELFEGDALSLSGSNSFFIHDSNAPESEQTLARLKQQDINITAPLWGKGKLDSQKEALTFESQIAETYAPVCQALEALDLSQQRRPVLVYPQQLKCEISDDSARLSFALPSGCFATSVLREIASISVGSQVINKQM